MAVFRDKVSRAYMKVISSVSSQTFAADVRLGLSDRTKHISSKYFYNEQGDKIFRDIMEMDAYYLTRCEYEILDRYKNELHAIFAGSSDSFQLIEFGAGDGYKTKLLLENFLGKSRHFRYLPVDISSNALELLLQDLEKTFPDLEAEGIQDDYFNALDALHIDGSIPKTVLFLGSNIGNFSKEMTLAFLRKIAGSFGSRDRLLIGFDLKKDPAVILNAYNDAGGITKAFNLNLLLRINEELGANFDIMKFEHVPVYDPESGEARSYLMSTTAQSVLIPALNETFSFGQWETIHTEISRKYSVSEIEMLADMAGFRIIRHFYDSRRYFTDSVWALK
jgi:L-histidine N-alpha-methyltransferase